MSTDLVKINGQLPAFLKGAAPTGHDKYLAGMKSVDFLPKISIKGKDFALVIGGERKRLPQRELEVVIVNSRAALSKMFYEKEWDGKAEATAPDCQSVNGKVPDSGVPNKQHATCGDCPQNVWVGKTPPNCRDHRVIIVVPKGAYTVQPFQLNLPAGSLKAFTAYVRQLKTAGIPPEAAVTVLSFADTEYPQLEFRCSGTVETEEQFNQVLALAERQDVQDVIAGVVLKDEESHASQQPVAIQPTTRVIEVKEPEVLPPSTEPLAAWGVPTKAKETAADVAVEPTPDSSQIESVIAAWTKK